MNKSTKNQSKIFLKCKEELLKKYKKSHEKYTTTNNNESKDVE